MPLTQDLVLQHSSEKVEEYRIMEELLNNIVGTIDNDDLSGTIEADEIKGDAGDDSINGGEGDDILRGNNGNDQLNGNAGADLLIGGRGQDTLVGSAGDDRLRGGNGRDILLGEAGDDRLRGGGGRDFLLGGAGRNILRGGGDRDFFGLSSDGLAIIRDFEVGSDQIVLEDFANVESTLEFDSLGIAQRGRNTVIELDGDRIAVLRGIDADTITAGSFTTDIPGFDINLA